MSADLERRSAFRTPATLDANQGTLEFNDVSLPVQVVNESATGFLVSAERLEGLQIDSVVTLHINDRVCQVRVVRLLRNDQLIRIGLRLIGDLCYVEQGVMYQVDGKRRRVIERRKIKWITLASTVGVVLTGLVVWFFRPAGPAVGDTGTSPIPRSDRPHVSDALRTTLRRGPEAAVLLDSEMSEQLGLTDPQRARIAEIIAASTTDQQATLAHAIESLRVDQQMRLQTILDEAASQVVKVQRYADRNLSSASVTDLYRRLGMAALVLPKVANRLELSDEQRQQILDIVERAFDEAGELQRQAADDRSGKIKQLQAEANAVLEQARSRVLAILSDAQRKTLDPLAK